jgi:hypothetical protein
MNASGRLSEAEAANMLDMEPQTLSKWRQRCYGPAYLKLGGKVSYRSIDLDAWVEQCRIVPTEIKPKSILEVFARARAPAE